MVDVIQVVDEHIQRYRNLSELAYDRCWFKEQEQYGMVVDALEELKMELI